MESLRYNIFCVRENTDARVAQLVERDLAKVEAAGSSPVSRFSYAPNFRGVFLYSNSSFSIKIFQKCFYFPETIV